jgi:RNA polymerase sigma-70 factor (ECF subfamily)
MDRYASTPPAPQDETALIESAGRGNLDAFNTLILQHQDALFNVAARTLGDDDLAADALQEALISAFRSLYTFHGGSFRAWLMRTVINKCYDAFRRTARHPTLPLFPVVDGEERENGDWLRDPEPSLQAQVEASELQDALQDCIRALPFSYRTVLTLVDVEGMAYDEAAAALAVPVGTVKSRLSRARAAMRLSLQNFSDLLPSAYQTFQPVPA